MAGKVPCSVCASPVPNNLVRSGGVVAFAHTDQIVIIQVNQSLTEVAKRQTGHTITSIRCVSFGGQRVIVTTSTAGVVIWDATLTDLLYEVPVTPAGSSQFEGEAFCQGVCMCCIADTFHICIGTSTGSMHLFSLSEPKSIAQAAVVDGDGVPVLALECLAGAADSFCVSSGDGQVSLYTAALDCMIFQKSVSMSAPVILLASTRQKILCGSIEGDISILEQGTLTVVMEIAAHSRFLSTMELHPSAPLLLTAAQDGTATVWDLEELYENKVKVRHSCLWNNAMITGGTFGPKDEFYLSSYSAPVLGMFNCQTVGL